jgi:hypothetical protein
MYTHSEITSSYKRTRTIDEIVLPVRYKSKTISLPDTAVEMGQFCSIGLALSAYIRNTYGTSYQKDHRLFAANTRIAVVC